MIMRSFIANVTDKGVQLETFGGFDLMDLIWALSDRPMPEDMRPDMDAMNDKLSEWKWPVAVHDLEEIRKAVKATCTIKGEPGYHPLAADAWLFFYNEKLHLTLENWDAQNLEQVPSRR